MNFAKIIYIDSSMFLITIFTSVLIRSTLAQIPSIGRCPNYPVVEDFKPDEYAGKWYEIEKYFAVFELGGKCITAQYTNYGNGSVGVLNSQIQQATGKLRTINGKARLISSDSSAKLGVTFPSVPLAGEAPYWVLKTDYKQFSIVWSCTDFAGLLNFQILWFLSRERNPNPDIRSKVYTHLKYLGLNIDSLQVTDQKNCGM